jgi:hypothetical protein
MSTTAAKNRRNLRGSKPPKRLTNSTIFSVLVREPRLPSSWMPSSMQDCDNRDELWKDAIHHEIWKLA